MIGEWRYLFVSLLCALVSACTTPTFSERLAAADAIANQAGFTRHKLFAGQFNLVSYQKIQLSNKTLTVYIEGDGQSYISRNRVSSNPTPYKPLGLQLAIADTVNKEIVYLARPCQFIASHTDSSCDAKYWTLYSYAPEVITSFNHALDQLKAQHGFSDINLVGFSGGGAVVILIAAQRQDIHSIRTVAGNLDIDAFTEYHRVSTMVGSLNPIDVAKDVAETPQRHFIGAEDAVVPKLIADSYWSQFDNKHCVDLMVIDSATHLTGWLERWPELVAEPLSCD